MGVFNFGFGIILAIIYLILIGLAFYCIILFIKLANRGIEALDHYNAKCRKM